MHGTLTKFLDYGCKYNEWWSSASSKKMCEVPNGSSPTNFLVIGGQMQKVNYRCKTLANGLSSDQVNITKGLDMLSSCVKTLHLAMWMKGSNQLTPCLHPRLHRQPRHQAREPEESERQGWRHSSCRKQLPDQSPGQWKGQHVPWCKWRQ